MQNRGQQITSTLKSPGGDTSRATKDKDDALFEMIEEGMKVLKEKLVDQCAPSELRAQMESLSSLVTTLSLRAEFISRLLDKGTPARLRDCLRSSASAMHIEPQVGGQEILSASNDLIKRGALLIAITQERINKEAHRETGYALKVCGLCKGDSGVPEGSCVVCKGRGSLVVREPAMECTRCEGKGMARGFYGKAARYLSLCAGCNGTGWITTGSK